MTSLEAIKKRGANSPRSPLLLDHMPGPGHMLQNHMVWTINNLEEYSRSNMLQDHRNAHCSRSILQTCSWSSVHSKMLLEHIWFRALLNIIYGQGPYLLGAYCRGENLQKKQSIVGLFIIIWCIFGPEFECGNCVLK